MASFDTRQQYAAGRGLEDAKAANALTQATGQTLVLINGGAATATLTFFAATYAAAKQAPVSISISVTILACSLLCFAIGVTSGACVLGFQGMAVQLWSQYWDSMAGIDDGAKRECYAYRGHSYNVKVGVSFTISVTAFVLGILILSASLVGLKIDHIG